jgi:hypothetical protein
MPGTVGAYRAMATAQLAWLPPESQNVLIGYGSQGRREVDPPIQVETATWSNAGSLDWWAKERRPRVEWWGRVRGADGRQRWIRAVDLRSASGSLSARASHRHLSEAPGVVVALRGPRACETL